ncbi:RNA polymerase sigma factor [Bacillus phage 035JT004]|nr:RNA polymerase sigma factor [Bacillus phage 035JT004]
MKLTVNHAVNMVLLEVETTGDEKKQVYLSPENIHYWYPFNNNFSYKYSNAKEQLYLVQEGGYTGENVYGVDILKRSKQLVVDKDGFLMHPEVYERNMYIMDIASLHGLPTPLDDYDSHTVQEGFEKLGEVLNSFRDALEDKLMYMDEDALSVPQVHLNEEWDSRIYACADEDDLEILQELGEVYNMLSLMRKLAEGR